jgi:hypothetical protein
MRLRLAVLGAGALALSAAGAADGQTRSEVRARQQQNLETARTVETAPGVSSPYALPVPEVSLLTTKDGTEATAVIGVSNPFRGFRTTFKTPIGKEADAEATPLSLSGLANQASVDFAFIGKRVFRDSDDIDDLRLAFCEERQIASSACSDQQFSGDEREAFLNYGMHEHPTLYTAHVQIGGKSFDFVERGTTAKVTEKFTSLAAGGSYGWLFLQQQSVFTIAVDAVRDYAGSKDTTLLCQPIATDVPGTERCDTRTIGRPTPTKKGTLTLDFRKVFTRTVDVPATPGTGGKPATPAPIPQQTTPVVGLSVQARVQVVDGGATVWGIEAPVYFLQKKPDQNKSVALNGGASAGWTSKDGVVARVFIGTTFALFGKDFTQ